MQNPGGHHASPASAAKSKSSTAAAASASGQGSSHHHHHHHSGGGGGGGADPTMNPALAKRLQEACRDYRRDPTVAAFNDVMTPGRFDNMYFVNLRRGLGLLATDQELYGDARTRPHVERYAANETAFFADFARAARRLSHHGVKNGANGEVRRRCDAYNGGGPRG